jgi:hypothetical protein
LQTIDLITLAFAESEGSNLVHSSGRVVSLLRLKTAVEDNLSNCNITCEELAAAAGISVRYANQLLDAEQTSLQRLLFSRRIAECQAALADQAQAIIRSPTSPTPGASAMCLTSAACSRRWSA